MTNTHEQREQQLTQWAAEQLLLTATTIKLTPIASDAGFRRYFRFATPSQWLAVDAPPHTEDSHQFVALARFLSTHGVSTPNIFAVDETQGFLLVEDFGDALFHSQLNTDTADSLYQCALNTLINLQHCPDNPSLIPRYDQALLHRELLIFSEWFAEKLLGYSLKSQDNNLLENLFDELEKSALEQPQTLVHRDYHSRNLLIRNTSTLNALTSNTTEQHENNTSLGVIDFQGALWGACTYDVVSLLRDCYVRWPATKVKLWALSYRQHAIRTGLITEVSETEFLRWFDWMGLQRHIKVLGIFARLHLRDGKDHYLQDLPLVIRYTLEVAQAYPQFHAFAAWFKKILLPLAEQQPWYISYKHAGDNP